MLQVSDPYNEMAGMVIESANDVLAGYQTWEEHIQYLKEFGSHLPFDLTERNVEKTMNEIYLVGGCKERMCHGEVVVITFTDPKGVDYISHGICNLCMKKVIMDGEPLSSYKGKEILYTKGKNS